MTGPKPDWSDPTRIPLGYARGVTHRDGALDPAYIQANLFTLAQIGGIYELLCLEVEKDHLVMLTEWRLDSGAPRAIDYIRNTRANRPQPVNEKAGQHA